MRATDSTKIWLAKAGRDVRSAKPLLDAQPPILDLAAFCCQQSIEKSLKAFLIFKGCRIPKIHDLVALYKQALTQGFEEELPLRRLAKISKYAVAYRYPGEAAQKLNRKILLSDLNFARNIHVSVTNRVGMKAPKKAQ